MSKETKVVEEKETKLDTKESKGTKPDENVPKARLDKVITERNELREKLEAIAKQEEEDKKNKLIEEGRLKEVNEELEKELETYKPYKDRFESLDGAMRETALNELPEEKREKFKNLNTPDLLNVVEELSVKSNPKDKVGAIGKKVDAKEYLKMDIKDKRKNWSAIIDSYTR